MSPAPRSARAEADVQHAVLAYLRLRGIRAWRINTAGIPLHGPGQEGRYRPAPSTGVADILAILPPRGRWLALEVKSATGRLTREQEAFLATIREQGGISGCVRSVEDVERLLAETTASSA